MFQYAFGRALAQRNNTELKLDITLFRDYEFHDYSLNRLNIIENVASDGEIASFAKHRTRKGKVGRILNLFLADKTRHIDEPAWTFNPELLGLKDPCYIDGYWQSEKYFLEIEDTIRKEFTLKKPLNEYSNGVAARILAAKNPVALHIRRGNFVNHPSISKAMGVCPPAYYEDAKKIIHERVEEPTYFIFSDDLEWTRENMKTNLPTEYIGQGPDADYMDIELMRLCKHHILSNSTFGWWGAWLSDHYRSGITIAPKRWNNKNFDTKDLVPAHWVTLPY
jgi:hypothetical protein